MKTPTFSSYLLDEMNRDEMQASDEDVGWRMEVAKIEKNRLKIMKMRLCSEMKMTEDETDAKDAEASISPVLAVAGIT